MTTPQPTSGHETIVIKDLLRSERINKIKDPFPCFYIDDFLPENIFTEIESQARDLTENSTSIFHGNRKYVMTTSYDFKEFLKKSSAWSEFFSKFSSQESFDRLIEIFKEINPEFFQENFLPHKVKMKRIIYPDTLPLFRKISKFKDLSLKQCSVKLISAYLIRYIFRKIQFELKVTANSLFSTPGQLLADISMANNGYAREIHRDSDNKMMVFLLYMSPLAEGGEGGELGAYSVKNHSQGDPFPPQPSEDECLLEQVIQPKRNRFFIFLNSDKSYHGVKAMKGHTSGRLFMYGGFTSFGKSMLRRSQKLKTEFHMHFT
tara:strand:- start:573 stop:1529 length:957 start_codon:yes stop_codon:yes gene_type:complete